MVGLFANNGDPDQMPRSAASDQGLHCLLITRLGVSSLQWVKLISEAHFLLSIYRVRTKYVSRTHLELLIPANSDSADNRYQCVEKYSKIQAWIHVCGK